MTAPGEPADRGLLARMCDQLVHRGPDASGYYCAEGVALGHRRLSIIDLAGGDQPIGNEDGSLQVVFNGEIYNYRELRSGLERRGHRFLTRSDTEVLVHLYEEVGEKLPEHLNGMFAFAIWDARRQELFVARDRLGKKPLYYSHDVPGLPFVFGSELKALTALPQFNAAINPRAVADFLSFSYIPDPDSIYERVHKLPPAHSLTVSRTGTRLRRYWAPDFQPNERLRLEETTAELRALAADAVACRMESDVPLGAFLSGGVDSSAVVGFMASRGSNAVKTFSIGFTDDQFDELYYAHIAAQFSHTDHHEKVVTPSIEEALGQLATQFDEPFGDSSAIPMLYLARMTRQHVTVALSGDGADELFGGYRRYRFGVIEERLRQRFPEWFRCSVIRAGARLYPKFDYLPQVFRAKTLLTNLAQTIGDAYFTSMTAFRDRGLSAVLSPDAQSALGGYSPRNAFSARFHSVRHLPPLEQMQAVDLETYLPGDILVKVDRTTMAHSLESRAPWLDYRIAELACRLPSAFKIDGSASKFIFKQAVTPHVPRALLTRKKMGFSVPLAGWLRGSLKPVFESLVLNPEMTEFICLPEVRRVWNEHQSGYHNHDRKLWNLLTFAAWHVRHFRSKSAAPFEELVRVH